MAGGVDMVAEHGTALATAIEAAMPAWVERSVERAARAAGVDVDTHLAEAARTAGQEAATDIGPKVRELLTRDIDEQTSNPLAIVRGGVRYATEVLRAAGVPAPERDEHQTWLLPDDVYDLAPATFADVGPGVAEPGVVWGAAKAYEFLRRRQAAPSSNEVPESGKPSP